MKHQPMCYCKRNNKQWDITHW